MAKVNIFLDPIGNTMNIWWGNPKNAYVSQESESRYDNDVIVKDRRGIPIGLEIIGVFPTELNIVKRLKDTYKLVIKEPFLLEAQ